MTSLPAWGAFRLSHRAPAPTSRPLSPPGPSRCTRAPGPPPRPPSPCSLLSNTTAPELATGRARPARVSQGLSPASPPSSMRCSPLWSAAGSPAPRLLPRATPTPLSHGTTQPPHPLLHIAPVIPILWPGSPLPSGLAPTGRTSWSPPAHPEMTAPPPVPPTLMPHGAGRRDPDVFVRPAHRQQPAPDPRDGHGFPANRQSWRN